MIEADDADTFVERLETLLMRAKVAKLELSETAKCSDFLPDSYNNLRSKLRDVFKQSSQSRRRDVI